MYYLILPITNTPAPPLKITQLRHCSLPRIEREALERIYGPEITKQSDKIVSPGLRYEKYYVAGSRFFGSVGIFGIISFFCEYT